MSEVAVSAIAVAGTLSGVALGGIVSEVREDRRRRQAARTALRVATDDIDGALEAVRDVQIHLGAHNRSSDQGSHAPDREWPSGFEQAAWTQSWIGYRDVVAQGLRPDEFSAVARAFGSLVQLERGLAAGRRPFIETDADLVARVGTRLQEAQRVLLTASGAALGHRQSSAD